jgi:uncharacterized protein YecE (DUF72 family)
MPKIYIGTAGWSYQDWIGSFYPKKNSANFDWLEFYSHYFNCVEVNTTYYAYTSDKVVNAWIRKTADVEDFTFTIKLHQDFTHAKNYDQQKINAVRYILDMLRKAERLGGLLIQFPYSFSFNDSNINYVKELREIFQNYDCFIEVRHKSWNNKNSFELFEQLDMVYATIDQPQIGEAIPFNPAVTKNKAYVRLHGRNAEAWKQSVNNFQSRQGRALTDGKKQTYEEQSERYNYLYSHSELIEIEQLIEPLLKSMKKIFIIFNNHPRGNAVANAFQLINLLEKRRVEIPRTTLAFYPQLSEINLC